MTLVALASAQERLHQAALAVDRTRHGTGDGAAYEVAVHALIQACSAYAVAHRDHERRHEPKEAP